MLCSCENEKVGLFLVIIGPERKSGLTRGWYSSTAKMAKNTKVKIMLTHPPQAVLNFDLPRYVKIIGAPNKSKLCKKS